MAFPAKRDLGTGVAFIAFVLALVGFGVYYVVIEGPSGGATAVVSGIVLVLTAFLWVWFWFGTAYEITSSHVLIRCGPLRSRIRIDEVVEAVPTSSIWLMLGGLHLRFALSRDAIMIKCSKKWWGILPYAVLISPQDKTGFLHALAESSSNLQRSDDGGVRCRAEVAG